MMKVVTFSHSVMEANEYSRKKNSYQNYIFLFQRFQWSAHYYFVVQLLAKYLIDNIYTHFILSDIKYDNAGTVSMNNV